MPEGTVGIPAAVVPADRLELGASDARGDGLSCPAFRNIDCNYFCMAGD